MKLRYKILCGFASIIVIALATLMVMISNNDACEKITQSEISGPSMRAALTRCYGSTDVISFEQVAKPQPAAGEVLVRVKAAAVNPLDWHQMRGSPYLMRLGSGLGKPKTAEFGVDFAGVVESVGDGVTQFAPGDEVFGGWGGAFAEYLVMPANRAIVKKPPSVSFAEAAAIPIAGLTAIQALVNEGGLQPDQRVLINGASGGVGTFATQIATAMGAHVSGVCSTRNVEMVKGLGADQVFDYKKEDYTQSGQQFDLIVDLVGNHSVAANRSLLTPNGALVIVGGPKGDWFAPMKNALVAAFTQPFVDQKLGMFIARLNQEDLTQLAEMMTAGEVRTRIDRTYKLDDLADAVRYSESGRARGKIIIEIE